MKLASNDPLHHTRKVKSRLRLLIDHLRSDVGKVSEPKAQALFETSAEVLIGLAKAFADYEEKQEAAWRTNAPRARSNTRSANRTRG